MATRNGTSAQDTISGTNAADTISGSGGGDILKGGQGDDVVYGFGVGDDSDDAGIISAVRITSGLDRPVFAMAAPGDDTRLYVVEQSTGKIQVVNVSTGAIAPTPFLDIPDDQLTISGEQGFLGMTFAPDYQTSGKVYVDISNAAGDTDIIEYTRSTTNPNELDLASRRVILTIDQPTTANHKAGWIGFGPDGYLYITSGDGGGGGDPNNRAQDMGFLLGKILRIDVNGDDFPGDDGKNYAIPADNPFVGLAGVRPEIFHLGLRNPFRVSFDSATGDMYIADVGQGMREELDFVPAGVSGLNFGWSIREGTLPFKGPDNPSLTDPVLDYDHGTSLTSGRAIIGGYVYHGQGGAQGLYFFADEASNHVFSTRMVNGQAQDFLNRDAQIREDVGKITHVTSFAEDNSGTLYTVDITGQIYRLEPSAAADDGQDRLYGGAGNDTVMGGAHDDYINAGPGDDVAYGGQGNDTFAAGTWVAPDTGFGNDTFNGGAGSDTLSFEDTPFAVTLNLSIAGPQGPAGSRVTLSGVENLSGWKFNDVLTGDAFANVLSGGNGNDILSGLGGKDTLIGGLGSDTMSGGNAVDFFVYTDWRESRGGAIDLITAFDGTNDRIDLRGVDADFNVAGDQAFTLVAAFDGHAGQLALAYDAGGGITSVMGDLTGDGVADFVVRIVGDHTTFSNFYL